MNDKTCGFVVSLSDYKDNDVMMQVLTKEYGFISLVAKGAKKVSGKNHFLPMCIYEFIIDYKDRKTIYTVHGSKLLNNYFEDRDIELMSFKNILIEATLKNKEMASYNYLSFVFEKMDKDNMYLLGTMYFSYLIKAFGITPIVDQCVVCGEKKIVAISNRLGGFLCLKHLGGEAPLEVEQLKKFRMMIKATKDNYDIVKGFPFTMKDFDLMVCFFLDNSDMRLKSYDFFMKL